MLVGPLTGSIHLIDESNMNVLIDNLANSYDYPSPYNGMPIPFVLCFNMDETNDDIGLAFPNVSTKATILCPLPSIIYKEMDGDHAGFIEDYLSYLSEPPVQEFIYNMIYYVFLGGNILLYTPSYLEDDAIWICALENYFFTEFGFTLGRTGKNLFNADNRYFNNIIDDLYIRNFLTVFEYINLKIDPIRIPNIASIDAKNKVMNELGYYFVNENPIMVYNHIMNLKSQGVRINKPGLIFVRR